MKNKILTFGFLSVLFALPLSVFGASVTVSPIPNPCGSIVIRGTASYTAPETLHVKLNGVEVASFTSGESSYQTVVTSGITESNTVTVEIKDVTNTVIASDSTSFAKANCGGTDPMGITQSWGLTGHKTPRLAVGLSLQDVFGLVDTCYTWMPKGADGKGCFDISNTTFYRMLVR